MEIGFAMCGSFCTFDQVFPIIELLRKHHSVTPIFSEVVMRTDSRFGTAAEHWQRATEICGKEPLHTIAQVEPIGPKAAGRADHCPLHREHPGEAGPQHRRRTRDHGRKKPSAEWSARSDCRFHQ